MGILSNLFKQKSVNPKAAQAEGRPASALSAFSARSREAAPEEEEIAEAPEPVEPAAETPLKNISLGGYKRSVTDAPTPAGSRAVDAKPRVRTMAQVKTAEVADKPVSVDLDDVLPQIPRDLLKALYTKDGAKGAKKTLLFNSRELLPGLSQGKAAAPVSRIAELAPELFGDEPIPAEAQVELPLQKIVAQIGAFPGRPGQVEEIYPPLEARYASLVVEKGGTAQVEEPVITPAAPVPAAEIPVAEIPAPVVVEETPPPQETPPVAAETSTNGNAESHAEVRPPIETVSYSLAAILPNVPESWLINGKSKTIDPSARITVPFDLIEMQLATGRVELPFPDFHQALPENLKDHFSGAKPEAVAAKVVIPLHEVFLNLPGVEPLPPAPAKPVAAEPEPGTEAVPEPAAKVEEPEPGPAPALVEAKAEPQPEVIQETVVEEEKPVEAETAPVLDEVPHAAPEAVVPQPPLEEEIVVKAEEPEAKVEPAIPVAPEPAAVAPVPEPTPEPPKEKAAPQIPAAIEPQYAEPEQADMQFITPSIQIQRLAPPPIITIAAMAAPEPEPTAQPRVEAKSPELAPPPSEPIAQVAPAAPAESAPPVEQAAPLAEPITPATPAAPDAATKPPLTDLIATDGKLDARKTVEHVILLPGVAAATLTIKGKTKTAGEIPEGFHAQETGKALFQSLENPGAKGSAATTLPRALSAHHDQFSCTWFKQNGILLCIVHPERSLAGEAHHAVLLVVQEIVRLRQH